MDAEFLIKRIHHICTFIYKNNTFNSKRH